MLAPVVAGYVKYDAIYDTRLKLVDFARMNDMLAAQAENRRRSQEASNGG